MNSIPLIKGNTPQEINTSIISLKKALAALEGNDKDVQNKIKQINELINGINSHLDTIDGQITDLQPIDIVTSGDMRSVTSGAVASALDVPKDAVLHYSFDEVPDYPDGTAVYFRNKNFTSADNWSGSGTNQITYPNGILTVASLTSGYVSKNFTSGNIVKAIVRVSTDDTFSLYCGLDGTSTELQTINAKANVPIEVIASIPSGTLSYVGFHNMELGSKFEVLSFYIGDGSYTTPVIDNANGQNNGTNNGGLAVKGVSGKGAYFLAGKYSQCDFNLTPNFTISVWVNPSDNANGKSRNIVHKTNQLILRNGASFGNYLQVYLYSDNGALLNGTNFGSLLPPNVWTHIVIVRNGLEFSMYKNGVKTRTIALADNTLRQNTEKFKVANEVNTGNQSVDDLLVFDRALSETEVKALYLNRANTPKYYSWADWKLNQMENANRSVIAETRSIEESGEEER